MAGGRGHTLLVNTSLNVSLVSKCYRRGVISKEGEDAIVFLKLFRPTVSSSGIVTVSMKSIDMYIFHDSSLVVFILEGISHCCFQNIVYPFSARWGVMI